MRRAIEQPLESELTKLCRSRRWEAARQRAMSHPSEAGYAPSTSEGDSVHGSLPSSSYSASTGNNDESSSGTTPLSIACREGAPIEAIRDISLACPDQLLVNHNCRGTVLHECIKHQAPLNVVSYIIESQVQWERDLQSDGWQEYEGSVFDRRDDLGRTPLHHMMERACRWIKEGAQVQTDPTATGSSSSSKCSFYGRWKDRDKMISVITMLLEAFPDAAAAPDLDGQTPLTIVLTIPATKPLDIGVELRVLEMVRLLLAANPSAALAKCQRRIKQVASQQRDSDIAAGGAWSGSSRGNDLVLSHTPLSCALSHGRSIITVRLLLDTAPQAALIPVGSERELCLHIAVTMRESPLEVLALLLRAGPTSAIARDRRSLTPIDWAWVRHVVDRDLGNEGLADVSGRRHVPTNYDDLVDRAVREIEVANFSSRDEVLAHPTIGPFWKRMELLLSGAHYGEISEVGAQIGVEEDSNDASTTSSWRVAHAAAAICCPRPIVTIALAIDSNSHCRQKVRERDEYDKLPLHYAAARPAYRRKMPLGVFREHLDVVEDPAVLVREVLAVHPFATRVTDRNRQLPLHVAIENEAVRGVVSRCGFGDCDVSSVGQSNVVRRILNANVEALERRDGKTRLYPFMQAAAVATQNSGGGVSGHASFNTCYELLRENPTLVVLGVPSSDATVASHEA